MSASFGKLIEATAELTLYEAPRLNSKSHKEPDFAVS